MSVSGEDFRHALGHFLTGVTVVSSGSAATDPSGTTASSFSSVSLEPPLVSVCFGHYSDTLGIIRETHQFGINILSESQTDLALQFAARSSEKNEGIDWLEGANGLPMLPECLVRVECRLHEEVTAGDHVILIGEVLSTEITGRDEGRPLVYYRGMLSDITAFASRMA
jgi:flavin reductase (DIM6/NTAB) family NADH-FMN oxidoreductase RutF